MKTDIGITPMTAEEINIDRFCIAFAQRYEVAWGSLTPDARESWRRQVADLLVYIDSTAFRGFLPPAGIPVEPQSGSLREGAE